MPRWWLTGLAVVTASAASLAIVAIHADVVTGHGRAVALDLPVAVAPEVAVPAPPAQVGAAAPLLFTMTGPAFRVTANVCSMPAANPLDPPGEQHHTVCWVERGLGVAPASRARGTSYLLGHAWAEDAAEVLNPLSIYAMNHIDLGRPTATTATSGFTSSTVPIYREPDRLAGYTITLRTAKGTLTYGVRDAFAVAKNQLPYVATVWNTTLPNRVVLITCGVHDGVDVDVNVVVIADLVSYRVTRP